MVCTRCGHEFEGKFCPECGKRSSKGRYTTERLREETIESLEIREGFLKTIFDLFIKPGNSIRNHLDETKELYNPLKLLLIIGAVSTFMTSKYWEMGVEEAATIFDFLALPEHYQYNKFSLNYLTFTNIVGVPLFALVSWVIFQQEKYNYVEHLILNTYIAAIQLLMLILVTPGMILFPENNEMVAYPALTLQSIYHVGVFLVFFKGSKIRIAFLTLITLAIGYIIAFFTNYLIFRILPEGLVEIFEIF